MASALAEIKKLEEDIAKQDAEIADLLSQLNVKPGEEDWLWICKACQSLNVSGDTKLDHCEVCLADCEEQLPVQTPPASRQNNVVTATAPVWRCNACMSENKNMSAQSCSICEADRYEEPKEVDKYEKEPKDTSSQQRNWKCNACMSSHSDFSATVCSICYADREQVETKPCWKCQACTTMNSASAPCCVVCEADRDESGEQTFARGWICTACMSENVDPQATECSTCFSDREVVKGWICSACVSPNEETNHECAICFADRDSITETANAIDISGGKRESLDAARARELLPIPTRPELVTKVTFKTKSFGEAAAAVAVELLNKLRNIEIADFSDIIAGRPTDEALAVLKCMCEALPLDKLRELDLSDNALGERGIRVLTPALQALSDHIEVLNFRNNGLSELSIKLFVEAIGNPTKLRGLHFFSNMSGNGGAAALQPLMKKLGETKSVPLEFTMSSCRVRSEGAEALCRALESVAQRLEFLDLSDSAMGVTGGSALAGLLKKCKSLKKLVLCDIGVEGSVLTDVISAISTLHSLEYLDFSINSLGPKHMKALLAAVQTNCGRLKVLKLAENESTAKGIANLLDNQSSLPFLETIDLRNNDLNDDAGQRLAVLLRDRQALANIELGDNVFSKAIIELLQKSFGDKLASLDSSED